MPDAVYVVPYKGAKPMLLVGQVDDPAFLSELISAMYAELPAAKKNR